MRKRDHIPICEHEFFGPGTIDETTESLIKTTGREARASVPRLKPAAHSNAYARLRSEGCMKLNAVL